MLATGSSDFHSHRNIKKPLLANSVSSVVLRGVATNDIGDDVPLTLTRRTPLPIEPCIRSEDPRGVPSRLPSMLPPPGSFCLKLALEDQISHGRVGYTFGVSVDDCAASEMLHIIPLIVKVSRLSRTPQLFREASFYDEMESLQGATIPRYYGFFELDVPAALRIAIWDKDRRYANLGDAIPNQPTSQDTLSILVLERLGDRLPLGEPLPEGAQQDNVDMYNDLSHLGIFHHDIRWANILRAAPSPPGLPGLPSPYHDRVYGWRIIDFDNSEKNDVDIMRQDWSYEQVLENIFDNIPYGYIVEPWE